METEHENGEPVAEITQLRADLGKMTAAYNREKTAVDILALEFGLVKKCKGCELKRICHLEFKELQGCDDVLATLARTRPELFDH